jgi:tripartite-type tricarboxylate transporter receptor subunit TctC
MLCRFSQLTISAACTLSCMIGSASADNSVEQFFRGKTINIYIGSAVGGGFDNYARLLARHLGKYIPGHPVIIPQNMPGAGSNKAAGYVFTQAAKDGTAIGAIQPGAVLQPLLSEQPVRHDPSKFIFLGSATNDVFLCFLRSDVPVKSFAETFTKEVIIGAAGEGATLHDFPVMLDNILGTKLRLVTGYAGSHEVTMAIERGEVQGMCGMGWSSLNIQHADWTTNGTITIIAQEDLKGQPEVNKMGVPLTVEFAKNGDDRQVMELIYSQNLFGRPYVLPPGVPAERVGVLRDAFIAAFQDKDLLNEARTARFDIAPMSGKDLQTLVAKLYALPATISRRAKQSMVYIPPAR